MSKLSGNFHTNAAGERTYEIYEASPQLLPIIADLLHSEFRFVPQPLLKGLDVYYLDCIKEDVRITIGWDIWSGCFIMPLSKTSNNNQLMVDIGAFLASQLENLSNYL